MILPRLIISNTPINNENKLIFGENIDHALFVVCTEQLPPVYVVNSKSGTIKGSIDYRVYTNAVFPISFISFQLAAAIVYIFPQWLTD